MLLYLYYKLQKCNLAIVQKNFEAIAYILDWELALFKSNELISKRAHDFGVGSLIVAWYASTTSR